MNLESLGIADQRFAEVRLIYEPAGLRWSGAMTVSHIDESAGLLPQTGGQEDDVLARHFRSA